MPPEPVTAAVDAMSDDGRGVAQVAGKKVLIQGALAGEVVSFRYTRMQRNRDEGVVERILQPSAERVEPACPKNGICGGCTLQHQQPAAQLLGKQRLLQDAFEVSGKVEPAQILAPLVGSSNWGYRSKARLGVKYVAKKGRVLVGFRERGSGFVCEIDRCPILDPRVGEILLPLAEMIGELSIRERLPQIEVAAGEQACVLVFRTLEPPSEQDRQRLISFCQSHGLVPYIQEKGPETVCPMSGSAAELHYRLPAYRLRIGFEPSDFIQVNSGLNQSMIERALGLLDPRPGERVLDLFCGLGNFTLPIARTAGRVVGVEGDPGLVSRARENARRNGIDNVSYHTANLYEPLQGQPWISESFDKVLLDPPRSGAREILEYLPRLGASRIVYVSCYPESLARDAGELVHRYGYRLSSAGVMDMFPHTNHIESIALFTI